MRYPAIADYNPDNIADEDEGDDEEQGGSSSGGRGRGKTTEGASASYHLAGKWARRVISAALVESLPADALSEDKVGLRTREDYSPQRRRGSARTGSPTAAAAAAAAAYAAVVNGADANNASSNTTSSNYDSDLAWLDALSGGSGSGSTSSASGSSGFDPKSATESSGYFGDFGAAAKSPLPLPLPGVLSYMASSVVAPSAASVAAQAFLAALPDLDYMRV